MGNWRTLTNSKRKKTRGQQAGGGTSQPGGAFSALKRRGARTSYQHLIRESDHETAFLPSRRQEGAVRGDCRLAENLGPQDPKRENGVFIKQQHVKDLKRHGERGRIA